ncbi:MAG: hypothetical protein AAGE85_05645 [Pseudomonadota bacterium]
MSHAVGQMKHLQSDAVRLARRGLSSALLLLASLSPALLAAAQSDGPVATFVPPAPAVFSAEPLERFPAAEARQGVAVDDAHFYAVANSAIGQYRRGSGVRVSGWSGPRGGLIAHLNSCFAEDTLLWCANSNHPEVPMASSVEVFDTKTMRHERSHSLGLVDYGSLTWFERHGDGWIAGFAHYNDRSGEPFKSNAYAGVHTFDERWRRTGGWRLPPALVERMAPQAASGGAIGEDGLLYVFGHHKPELYVLAKPAMGPTLLHIATIDLDAEGQAFVFDPRDSRVIWAISRPAGEVRTFRLPEIPLEREHAERF